MELPIRVLESVHRVATRSFTKIRAQEHKNRRVRLRTRSSRVDDPNSSSSNPDPEPEPILLKAIMVEKGVEESRIPRDISIEVREELEKTNLGVLTKPKRVRFDDIPVIIKLKVKPDDYDII